MTTTVSPPAEVAAPLSSFIQTAVQKHFKKSIKWESEVLADCDPEPLHQMRVGMRRLRTALQVFQPAIVLPGSVSPEKIAKIARVLGEVRDRDVLKQTLTVDYYPQLPKDEQKCLDRVLQQLKKQRHHQFVHLKQTLQRNRYHKLKQGLQTWLKHPAYTEIGQMSLEIVLPDLLLPLISQLLLHPGWLVTTPDDRGRQPDLARLLQQQGTALHSLRKQAKRVRYQTEFFINFYGEEYARQVDNLEQIQESLGKIQDHIVLIDFLSTSLGQEVETAMPHLARYLQHQLYQAWQTWQTLRQPYLQPEFRATVRSQGLFPQGERQPTGAGNDPHSPKPPIRVGDKPAGPDVLSGLGLPV